MTVAKTTTKKAETLIKKIDWVDLGTKTLFFVGTAFASGYVSAAGSDLYQKRKIQTLASDPDSNVLLMDKAK